MVLAGRYDKVLYQRKRDEIVAELKALETPTEVETEKGGHDVHLSKNCDNLGDEYGLSGRHAAKLMRVNQCLPEIKEMLDQGKIIAYSGGSVFLFAGTGATDGFGGIGEIRHQYHGEDRKRYPQGEDEGEGYSISNCESGF